MGGYMHLTTMKRTTRHIERRPEIWYLVIWRRCTLRSNDVGVFQTLARVMHAPITFLCFFNLIYANAKVSLTPHKKTKKPFNLSYRLFDSKGTLVTIVC
jgi:hypothetical protein